LLMYFLFHQLQAILWATPSTFTKTQPTLWVSAAHHFHSELAPLLTSSHIFLWFFPFHQNRARSLDCSQSRRWNPHFQRSRLCESNWVVQPRRNHSLWSWNCSDQRRWRRWNWWSLCLLFFLIFGSFFFFLFQELPSFPCLPSFCLLSLLLSFKVALVSPTSQQK
jgi:hypothetical protein